MLFLLKNIFNPNQDLTLNEQKKLYMLRHALMGTFSFSLTLWLNTIFDVPQYVFSFFFAIILVYFDFAEKLWQQLIEVFIVGNLIGLLCFLAAVVSPSAYLSTICFIVLATSLFTLGQYGPRLSLFGIFAIYMLSFSSNYVGTNWYDGLHCYMAMFVGMSSAMVAITLFTVLPKALNIADTYKKWLAQFNLCLSKNAEEASASCLPFFNTLSQELSIFLRNKDDELSILINDINKYYTLLLKHIQTLDKVFLQTHLEKKLNEIFSTIQQGLQQNQTELLNKSYELFVDHIIALREKNIVQQLELKQRMDLAHILLDLEKITKLLDIIMQSPEVKAWLTYKNT